MKFVKLFEEFSEGNPVMDNSSSRVFIYYIHKTGKDFSADVRDPDGKVVAEVNASDISNDSQMKDENDIPGLIQLLIGKNKLKQGDTVVPSSAAKAEAQTEFAAEVNTNM